MAEISAVEKHACPACGAQAEWSPSKQMLVCPFCGTESPYDARRGHGRRSRRLDLVRRCASCPDEQRGWQTERRSVQCQSCKAVMVLRPGARRPELRVLRLAGAGRLRGDQVADPAAEPAAVQGHARPRSATASGAGTASKWFAPGALKRKALVDQIEGPLRAVLDLRRAGPLPVDGRGGPLLLRQRGVPRQPGPARRRARCRRSAGSRPPGELDHFFDDEPVPGTTGRRPGRCCGRSSRSRRRSSCRTTPATCRATSSSTTRSCWSTRRKQRARGDGRAADGAVRRSRCRATRTATCGSARRTRARRSSTSSCRSGC